MTTDVSAPLPSQPMPRRAVPSGDLGRTGWVRAPRISIHDGLAVCGFGTGEPVFFMPGPHRFQRPGLRSADALIDGLVGLGREVVTFEPPGSGRSTRPARLGMEEMIACSDEVLDGCGLRVPVDALGHSMGGFALIAYALARPSRIRRLVLVGTGGEIVPRPGQPSAERCELGTLAADVRARPMIADRRKTRRWLASPFSSQSRGLGRGPQTR